jgi:ubiquinone biosynthesis protein COQ9
MTAESKREAARQRLLAAALAHVVFDGWTRAALQAGAADAELDLADADRLFPGGPAEMVRAYSDWADADMAGRLAGADLDGLATGRRIAHAVRARIEALAPHREAARRAAGFLARPDNAPLAASCLYRTVDAMWRAAGDRSADFSFYTKRASLAAVYGATLLHWLDDESEDAAETWAFLDRRLADVMRLGRLRRRCESLRASLPDPFRRFTPRAFARD